MVEKELWLNTVLAAEVKSSQEYTARVILLISQPSCDVRNSLKITIFAVLTQMKGKKHLPCWISFISRCKLDIKIPTVWDRFPSSSLIIWKDDTKQIRSVLKWMLHKGFINIDEKSYSFVDWIQCLSSQTFLLTKCSSKIFILSPCSDWNLNSHQV